jgi:hypothetical protein
MKKIVAFLLVALMACTAFPALAVDISRMSFDELVELRAQVDAAIIATGEADWFTVPQGSYLVGEQLPAGNYTVELLNESDGAAMITVYKNEDGSGFEGVLNYYSIDVDSGIGCLKLKKGNKFEVTFGSTRFKKFTGLN